MDKNKVTQSNKLIEASHTLTLNEKRLVLCAASMIDSRRPMPKDGYITIHAERFADIFGMELRHAYESMKEASNRLFNRDVRRYEGGKVVERMRWVFHVKYKEGTGCVELGFSPTVAPHLSLLNKEFTSYQLRQIGGLTSFYAIRIYELMRQFSKTNNRECSLERIKEMLDITEKYKNVKDLKRWVLEPALKEVNERTDIEVAMESLKKGRSIVGFKFSISNEKQMKMEL
ncbi:Replication initiation protein [Halomonadaceae bacterium LMG 33818]|uniref:replication initiation protein n=1 Tax=Cernens ardua TaxID=3402176 RepID=UPI003EDBD20C